MIKQIIIEIETAESAKVKVAALRSKVTVIISYHNYDGTPAVESHPFHLHTNHFFVVDFATDTGVDMSPLYRKGEWRDTIFVPRGNVTIRWVPRHYTGKSLLHCHILTHEDMGMSWAFDIME